MNKGFTVEEADRTVKDVAEIGIRPNACIISGYPYETKDDIKKTVAFIKRNKKYIVEIPLYQFTLRYGSPLYLHPENYGIKNIFSTNYFSFFAFDESRGLKWEQKQKQQRYSFKKIRRAVRRNIESNRKRATFYYILSSFFILYLIKIKRFSYRSIFTIKSLIKKMAIKHEQK